jgi:N-acetylmuramoyl-L-alanine amidase
MVSIAISSGHGLYVRGASGYLDEVDCARAVVNQVVAYLEQMNVTVWPYHDNQSHSQSENLNRIVSAHNSHPSSGRLDVSVHLNAYSTTPKPMGTETLYVSSKGEALARELSPKLAAAGEWPDRGPKYNGDLAFLNGTTGDQGAILIEVCFVDSKSDADHFNNQEIFIAICKAIAETISGETLPEEPEEPGDRPPIGERPDRPPPEGPTGPVVGTVHGLAVGDSLNIRASASSGAPIIGQAENNDLVTIVSSALNGDTTWYKLQWGDSHMAGVAVFGWASAAYIRPDGEVPPAEDVWHTGITATEFGEGSDEQQGAYGEWIDGNTRGVSFPYKWRDSPRPMVEVAGPGGTVVVGVCDVGPWNTDDPNYVLGSERPLAESQYADQTEAQNGMVPSNPAGIDLTAPIANEVGISGKGKVNWRLVPDAEVAMMQASPHRHKGTKREPSAPARWGRQAIRKATGERKG